MDANDFSEHDTDCQPEQYLENKIGEWANFPADAEISWNEYEAIYAYKWNAS